ncbi:aromatic-L-amino acid decarboxylase [Coccidioides immitis RS]|uniref:Aromatic-L-amino acid decarboxylase n=2 Tax=Coccidioides immitis TaxID=5501 RepID=J3K5I9_COCIM|nr:aromatic-L-amino acid decarboxylase [Coccidioides immitis RS]EAS29707.3 aromatic-L-amino acid decarboxylase [Coccidioides immitis RS]KMP06711.1 aromatic-L-amino-acid decarboxylase [Coccidioides immitis RMSCC 2394]
MLRPNILPRSIRHRLFRHSSPYRLFSSTRCVFNMDAEQFRQAAQSAIEEIIEHFNTLPSRRVLPNIEPGYLRPLLPQSPPKEPESWEQIQLDIESKIKPGLTHWQSPHFMAFFPALVTYPSILGEMYSAAFSAPAFNWLCSPACTELEIVVLDWVAQAIGLPECFHSTGPTKGGGVIQGSASEAVVTVMVAARERMLRDLAAAEGLKEDTPEWEDKVMSIRGNLVALGSDQAHSCTAKGARIVGTRYRSVPTALSDNFEVTGASLRRVLEECEAAGLVPYYLTTTLGTTSTCATDRFAEIKAVLASKPSWQKIWVHIDAAYAGAALVTPEYQPIAREWDSGIDSFNFNMHKWLLVNFDASCLFVRNRTDVTSAMDITPAYLRNPYSELPDTVDFRNWQIPLGRRFRALKIWFVMRAYGLSGMRAFIYKGLHHGDVFVELCRGRKDLFTIVTPPAFGLTVFRVTDEAAAAACGSTSAAITREVYEKINAGGEIFITSSVVGGIYVIRVVSGSWLSEEKYVRRAFDIIAKTTEETLAGKKTNGVETLKN